MALLAAPALILLHEVGHHSAQLLLGFKDPDPISYSEAGLGVAPAGVPEWVYGVVSTAGPLVSLTLACLGIVVARLGGPASLALALPTVDCLRVVSRLLLSVYFAKVSLVRLLAGGGFSEFASVAQRLDLPVLAVVLAVVGLMIPFVALTLVCRALKKRGTSPLRSRLGASMLGAITGTALWMTLLGPFVLP